MRPERAKLMGVLGRYGLASGAYVDETPDTMAWLECDVENVLEAIDRGEEPVAPLIGSGFWPEDAGPLPEDLRAEIFAAYFV